MSAAQQYDARFNKAPTTCPRHQIYYHDEQEGIEYGESFNELETYDIDSPISMLSAFGSNQCLPLCRPMLSRDQWMRLTPQAQRTWDQLDDETKVIIIGKLSVSRPPGT